jgi:hypothetical protein
LTAGVYYHVAFIRTESYIPGENKLICYLNSDCITDSKSQSEFLYLNGIKKNSGQLNFLLKGSLSGVDLGRFNQKDNSIAINDLRVSLGFKNSDFILGYIARKSLDKGCMDMLNVFGIVLNSFPAVKLLFIGPDESNGLLTKFFDENPKGSELDGLEILSNWKDLKKFQYFILGVGDPKVREKFLRLALGDEKLVRYPVIPVDRPRCPKLLDLDCLPASRTLEVLLFA